MMQFKANIVLKTQIEFIEENQFTNIIYIYTYNLFLVRNCLKNTHTINKYIFILYIHS